MIFPFYTKLKEAYPITVDKAELINKIEQFITDKKIEVTERSETSIEFKTSFFGWNWEYFALVEKGAFTILEKEIVFEFFVYKRILIIGLLSTFFVYKTSNPYIYIIFFIIIFINWIISIFRYKKMLKLIVEKLKE